MQILVKDPEPMLFHAELVRRDGKAVGYMRAASYGHTLGGAVGLAMIEPREPVDAAYLAAGSWEVEIAAPLSGRGVAAAALRPGDAAHSHLVSLPGSARGTRALSSLHI